jgi:hypothetical protein
MANYPLKEFIRIASTPYGTDLDDPIHNIRLRKDMLYPPIDMDDRGSIAGPGRKGGCYVYICENCGFADYTRDHHQQFCCKQCKKEFYENGRVSKLNTTLPGYKSHTLHRRCAFCDIIFPVKFSDIYRGKGIYCSRNCTNRSRGFRPLWYQCNTCGRWFKAAVPEQSYFCSIECEDKYTRDKESVKYKLSSLDHMIDHLINRNLKYALNHMRKKKNIDENDIRITPRLRVQMEEKNNNRHYLEEKGRKTKEDKDVIKLINLIDCDLIFTEKYLSNPPDENYIDPEPWKIEKDTTWIKNA